MKTKRSALVAVSVAAFALAGCSGAIPANSSSGVGALPGLATHTVTGTSWIRPGSGPQKLLYVTDSGSGTVKIYAYPSLTYTGELTGFSQPLFDCADKAGNVWIVDYNNGEAVEYAHGGTSPVKTLSGLSLPYECSVNRKNGDLAVAENVESASEHLGEVAVFHHATGTPKVYSDSNFGLISGVTYDSNGNLFADGYTTSDAFHYAELPAASSTFTDITLNQTPGQPGMIFWDGQFVDIGDFGHTIYQTQGSNVVNSIALNLNADTLRGFFVFARKRLIATDAYANAVDVFAYPAGGAPAKDIASGLNTPWCVVLSP